MVIIFKELTKNQELIFTSDIACVDYIIDTSNMLKVYCPNCYANHGSDRDFNDPGGRMYIEGASINLHDTVTVEDIESIRRILRDEEPEASWSWNVQRELLEKCIRKRVKKSFSDLTDNSKEKRQEREGI